MYWQVALVLDEESDASKLLGQMPVWIRSTPEREASASKIRRDWSGLWSPEPAYTLIHIPTYDDPSDALQDLISTLEMHHSSMVCVRICGALRTESLISAMASSGYQFLGETSRLGIGFAKPLDSLIGVRSLDLDARAWRGTDDLLDSFFKAVGAPDWHGRNLDALNDSIATGNINAIEVPFRIVVRNASSVGAEAGAFLRRFADLIRNLQDEGCPVEMRIVP